MRERLPPERAGPRRELGQAARLHPAACHATREHCAHETRRPPPARELQPIQDGRCSEARALAQRGSRWDAPQRSSPAQRGSRQERSLAPRCGSPGQGTRRHFAGSPRSAGSARWDGPPRPEVAQWEAADRRAPPRRDGPRREGPGRQFPIRQGCTRREWPGSGGPPPAYDARRLRNPPSTHCSTTSALPSVRPPPARMTTTARPDGRAAPGAQRLRLDREAASCSQARGARALERTIAFHADALLAEANALSASLQC